MTNKVQGVIEAHISEGRTIKLVFDFNTWADAEAETGLKLKQIVEGLKAGSLSAVEQRALFWCAMREHQPEMTLRDAGRVLAECAEAMAEAVGASMPPDDDELVDEEEAGEDREAGPQLSASGAGTNS